MSLLSMTSLCKTYQANEGRVVDEVSLSVEPGELVTLLGPSGCGKTTLLRMIAGFTRQDSGEVILDGTTLADSKKFMKPEKRHIGFVFQDYALFPHMSVRKNLEFGLKGESRDVRQRRVSEALEMVHMTGYEHRRPDELSGGQQQRIALARALAIRPKIVLLDEPFSGLDAAHRARTRTEVRRLLKAKNISAVLVTHDQDEAMSVSDRVAVMRHGRVLQIGTPEALYREPKTAFVARFLGRTNLVTGHANGQQADTPLGKIELAISTQGQVLLSLRPEDLHLQSVKTDSPAKVIAREFLGASYRYWIQICETEITAMMDSHCGIEVGEQVMVLPSRPAVIVQDDRLESDTAVN